MTEDRTSFDHHGEFSGHVDVRTACIGQPFGGASSVQACACDPHGTEAVDLDEGIDGRRSLAITDAYVTAFLDRTVRGRPEPLLTGRTTRYAEVHDRGCPSARRPPARLPEGVSGRAP